MRRGRYRYRLTELGLEYVTAELCLEGPADLAETGQ
jgi:hypothetical protein